MKKLAFVCCLLAAVASLHARGIREEADLAEEKSRTSYALGMIMGLEFASSEIELDYQTFTDGLRAAMENEPLRFSREEAWELAENAFEAAAARRNEESRIQELLFLAENGERPEIVTTASGLQYEALVEGGGDKPEANDRVAVLYEGMLLDGTVFDSWDDADDPAQFPLNGVISGWSEGLRLMSVGSKYRLYIPSELAYGESGAGQIIPPYSTLIFTVELLDIIKPDDDTQDEDSPPSQTEY
jgi:FKBP-type peptidyl-prolyl cis-trans isomerase